jgi:predicted RNase H-like HicB family nuclease
MVHLLLRGGSRRQRPGQSREECLASLKEAIALILEHRREESLRSLPPDPGQELVVVG